MDKITIRKPIVEDAFDIRRIQSEGWLDNNLSPETGITEEYLRSKRNISIPPSDEKIRETASTIEKNEGDYFVATNSGKVVGWIMSSPKDGDIYGFGIYVDRQHRGKDVGSMLLQKLFSVGKRKYFIEVTSTNLHGIKFYEKHGFKVIRSEKHYFDDEKIIFLPVVIMQNYE